MKRSQRIGVVQHVTDEQERSRARSLAVSEQRVREGEAKLAELEAYRASYVHEFNRRAGGGIDAAQARDYQIFLARLDEALRQQAEIVERARGERAQERIGWQGAARRARIVGRVVENYRAEERRSDERREQAEVDERAQQQNRRRAPSEH